MDLKAALARAKNALKVGKVLVSAHAEDDKLPLLGIFHADVDAVIESADDGVAENEAGTK